MIENYEQINVSINGSTRDAEKSKNNKLFFKIDKKKGKASNSSKEYRIGWIQENYNNVQKIR